MARTSSRKKPITPQSLTELVSPSDPYCSPDGNSVLYTRAHTGAKNNRVSNLWIAPAAGGTNRQFTSGETDRHGRWSPCGSTIAFIRSPKDGTPQIWTIPADGGEATPLTSFDEGAVGGFEWSPDGKSIAVTFRAADPQRTKKAAKERKEEGLSTPPRIIETEFYRLDGDGYFEGRRFTLQIVDVAAGTHREIYAKDTMGFFGFSWAPDSRRLAVATNRHRHAMTRPELDELIIVDSRTKKIRTLDALPPGPKSSPAWSPDGSLIAFCGYIEEKSVGWGTENMELWVCDVKTGRGKSLTGKTDYCLVAIALGDAAEAAFAPAIRWTTDSKHLLFSVGWHGARTVMSIKRSGRNLQHELGGQSCWEIGNITANHIVMLGQSAVDPPELFIGSLTLTAIETKQITTCNRDFRKTYAIAKPTSKWITAADGHRVHTWIMRPPSQRSRRRGPGILQIHGGPHAMYGWAFFHEFQCQAAAGYTIYYANPRGSKGYGQAHCSSIRGNWGSTDWTDIEAVRDAMLADSKLDPGRLCVMGGSYGGYMTNWAIGHCNDFACAITDRCVSNLVSMGGNSDFFEGENSYFPGNFWSDAEGRWSQSPIRWMGKTRTPTLIIHSEGDLRCNVEQAEQVFALLKLRNVPTRFVRYPQETSHGFSRCGPADLRIHRLQEIMDWTDKYLQ